MRNRLECSVNTCRHNSNNLCDLPSIKVEGPGARHSSQTCCESYEERSTSGTNGVFGSYSASAASPDTSIDCKAQNCVYNDNCKCEAECVCVGCCCTDVTSKSGTECCTFQES